MKSFQVTNKELQHVTLNSDVYHIAWYSNIRKQDNSLIQASDIEIGDSVVLSNGYFYLQSKVINPLSNFSDFLSTASNKQHVASYYKYIRTFPTGSENFNLCFAYKIVEFSYIWKNPKILNKLSQSVVSYSKSLIDYFLSDMSMNTFASSFDCISNSISQLKFLGHDILKIYNFNYTICLEDLGISLKTIKYPEMTQVYLSNSGVIEFVFLDQSSNYSILYTDEEVSLLRSEGDLKTLQKFYTAQHNLKEIEVDRREKLSSTKKENKEIIDMIVRQVKFSIENLIIDNSVNHTLQFLRARAVNVYELEEAIRSKNCSVCKSLKPKCFALDCKHFVCEQCLVGIVQEDTNGKIVLNDEEKKYCQASKCRVAGCFGVVKDEILPKVFSEYQEYKRAANARLRFNCANCSAQFEIDHFLLSCRHLCNQCALTSMRTNNFYCAMCGDYYKNEDINKLVMLKQECGGCKKVINVFKGFPEKICEHDLCINCLYKCSSNNKCIVDYKPVYITPSIAQYKIKNCMICSSQYNTMETYELYKSCICQVCEVCLMSQESISSCRNCYYPFAPECLEYLNKTFKKCQICYLYKYEYESVLIDPCSHNFCKDCIELSSSTNFKSRDIDSIIKCPECFNLIAPKQYDILFSKEIIEHIIAFKLEEKSDFLTCFKCKNYFKAIEKLRKQRCNKCEASNCLYCQEQYHEEEYDCKEKYLEERLREMEGFGDANGVSQCPGCRFPYTKNHQCDHVNCVNRKCGMIFCFKCSCVRAPVVAHGNHYHRPGCDYYSPFDGDDMYKGNCPKCVKTGKLCERPKDLKTKRRITKDEVEEVI